MKSLTLFTLTLCVVYFAQGQGQTFVVNQNAIDDTRYEGIEKNPYLFKEFVKAKAYNQQKDEITEYTLNYNGYTSDFEFIYDGKKIPLDHQYYDVIEVESFTPSDDLPSKYTDTSARFVKGLDPSKPGAMHMELYAGKDLKVFKSFEVRLINKPAIPGSSTGPIDTFLPTMNYLVVKDDNVQPIGLNKKKLVEALENAKIESFIKKNKIKLKNENDLLSVLDYYGEITEPGKPESEVVVSKN